VQVLGAAGNELLHQRHADALRRAALHLALDQVGLTARPTSWAATSRSTRVRPSSQSTFGQMRAPAEGGIGLALPVRVERVVGGSKVPSALST
jgi:hypothetical protein